MYQAASNNKTSNLPRGVYKKPDAATYFTKVPAYKASQKRITYGGFATPKDAAKFRLACFEANELGLAHPPHRDPSERSQEAMRVSRGPVTVAEAFTTYLDSRRSTVGVKGWLDLRRRADEMLAWCRAQRDADGRTAPITYLRDLSFSDISRMAVDLQALPLPQRCSHPQVRQAIYVLHSTFEMQLRDQRVTHIPLPGRWRVPKVKSANGQPSRGGRAATIDLPEHPRVALTLSTAKLLAEAVQWEYHIAVWLQMLGGLRVGEVWGLRFRHLDFERGTIRIQRQGGTTRRHWDGSTTTEAEHTKTDAGMRELYVPRVLLEGLQAFMIARHGDKPDPDAPVMHTTYYGDYHQAVRSARQSVAGLMAQDLGGTISPHFLRKSCATVLHAQGVPGAVVSDYLGHRYVGKSGEGALVTAATYTLSSSTTETMCADSLEALMRAEVGSIVRTRTPRVKPGLTGLLTVPEIARLRGVTPAKIHTAIKHGIIRSVAEPPRGLVYAFRLQDVAAAYPSIAEAASSYISERDTQAT